MWKFCLTSFLAVHPMAGPVRLHGGFASPSSRLLDSLLGGVEVLHYFSLGSLLWLVWSSGAEGLISFLLAAWFTIGLVRLVMSWLLEHRCFEKFLCLLASR